MDKEGIQEYCEECGDYDRVLFTFDDEDKNEPYKSIVNYFKRDLVLNKKKLEEKLYCYDAYSIGIIKAKKEIKEDIIFSIDEAKDIFKSLLSGNDIDRKTYDKLIKTFNSLLQKQLEFINNFDYSKIKLKKYEQKIKKRD